MKKILIFTFIVLFIGTCVPAYAGIFDTAKDWIFENALGTILAGIFLVVSGFFSGSAIGKIILKSKIPIYELKDLLIKVHDARKPSGPGGAKVTSDEKDAILKEVEDLIKSVVEVFGKTT